VDGQGGASLRRRRIGDCALLPNVELNCAQGFLGRKIAPDESPAVNARYANGRRETIGKSISCIATSVPASDERREPGATRRARHAGGTQECSSRNLSNQFLSDKLLIQLKSDLI
jgi:hypothetical protein